MVQATSVIVWIAYFIGLYFTIFQLYAFLERYEFFMKESKNSHLRRPIRFPKVSVIIPAFNEASTIKECILSVANLNYPKDKLEILVINDGSTDNTREIASEVARTLKTPKIKVISQENFGKGNAVNHGLSECSGEFFACLDSDSFVQKETLQRMLYVFEQQGEKVAIVTPAMKIFNPTSMIQKFQRIEYLITLLFNRVLSQFDALYVAPGPFSLYRTDVIRKLGGFDEHNITEDQEIGYRAQHNDYKLKHCFDAYVYTSSPKTIPQLFKQRSRWWRGSIMNFFKYKYIFLNPKYGHLGIFQLPAISFGFFTVFLVTSFFIKYTILPWIRKLQELSLTGFDLPTLLRSFSLSFDLFSYDFGKFFLIASLLAVSVSMFYLAHKSGRESFFRHGFVYLPLYFLFYYLLLSFIYVTAALQLLITRKDKWLGKST
jgi:poly-beta-1,6-N-acetyl-D-glucosamine synthase